MNRKGQQTLDGWAIILFLIGLALILFDNNTWGGVIVIILAFLRIFYVIQHGH